MHSLLVVASRPQVVDQEAASSDWKFEGIAPVIKVSPYKTFVCVLENISSRLLVSFQLFSNKHKYFYYENRKYKLYLTAAQHIYAADVVN